MMMMMMMMMIMLAYEHTTNLATGVSRQPVLDCGMIFQTVE